MADRYWVGGTGTWSNTLTTNWASTSGGAAGASAPTTADNVIFDVNSDVGGAAFVVTLGTSPACLDFSFGSGAQALDAAMTLSGTGGLTIAGSLTLVAANLTVSVSSNWSFTATTTGKTITTAGHRFTSGRPAFNGVGGGWTFLDAVICGNSNNGIDIFAGTLNTNNQTVTTGNIFTSGSLTRSLILGSSNITLTSSFDPINFSGTNFTLNAGTSTITCNGTASTGFTGGGNTFYNVSFTASTTTSFTMSGVNTFNNLSITSNTGGMRQVSMSGNQTVNGTFTCSGGGALNRVFIRSNLIGTTRTITAAAVSSSHCDFRDITIAGAASPISPTGAGDCGGNSGITFPAAKTVYRVGTNTTWEGASSWALTSNGAGTGANFPLAQDTAVIDNNTTLTGTLSLNIYNIGSIDCSTRTTAITLNHNATASLYGSYILGSGMTISGTSVQTFSGRGTQTFTSAGKTITFPITIDKPAGAFELGDAYTSSSTITHTRGTFDAKTYNLTCTTFASNNTNVRTINMGSGLWTITGTSTVWAFNNFANLTFNKGTANILLSNITTDLRIFNGGSNSILFNKLTIGGATGTSVTFLQFGGTFTELASTKTVAHTIRFQLNSPGGIVINNWSITGTAGNLVTVDSASAGTRQTFTLTNSTFGLIDYLSVKDIGVTSPNLFFVGNNSIDGGNNLNVYFTGTVVPATGSMFAFFIP